MADPTTADARLRRILHILPAAARDGGAALEDLAADLDVEPATVLEDLETVTARSYYLPAGAGEELQIQLTAERVQVWTTGDFERPVKLLPREALALGLGLRALAASGSRRAAPEGVKALRRRLERHLATADTEDLQGRFHPDDPAPSRDVPGTLFRCARERTPCRIRYLKPGAPAPQPRTVHPYVVARAEGRWYAIGRDPDTPDDRLRVFRLDRMVEARATEGAFTVPDAFDASDYVDRGRVYDAPDETEVVVRYSPRIARWIREKPWARVRGRLGDGGGADGDGRSHPGAPPSPRVEERADGSLIVRHRVADPRWIVSHVLQYGPDAEVLEPEGVRERVLERVERLVG